jgi:hypothetical protein
LYWHFPFPEQSFGHFIGVRQSTPVKPAWQTQVPATHFPWPLQSLGHFAGALQSTPV